MSSDIHMPTDAAFDNAVPFHSPSPPPLVSEWSWPPTLLSTMPPALIVLLGALFIELVSWVGFTLISEHLFALYRSIFCRSSYQLQAQLRTDITALRTTVKSISAMDEFAKWARIRRQLDGKLAGYEEISSELRSTRSMFLLKAQLVVRALFYLLYVGLALNYRTTPMFHISEDWVGGGIFVWVMSLPFAPTGAVSVVIWVFACRRVLRNILELILGDQLDQVKEAPDSDPISLADLDDDKKMN